MTRQIAEKLAYNGQKYELHTEPLSLYLDKHPIERTGDTYIVSTACWRGYVGHWTIEDDKLYLVELDDFDVFRPGHIMGNLFPGQEKVFAEWFSGTIRTTLDDMYMYLEFKLENGRLVEVWKKEDEYIRNLDFDKLLDSLEL